MLGPLKILKKEIGINIYKHIYIHVELFVYQQEMYYSCRMSIRAL